jgi:hypothetical protein
MQAALPPAFGCLAVRQVGAADPANSSTEEAHFPGPSISWQVRRGKLPDAAYWRDGVPCPWTVRWLWSQCVVQPCAAVLAMSPTYKRLSTITKFIIKDFQ